LVVRNRKALIGGEWNIRWRRLLMYLTPFGLGLHGFGQGRLIFSRFMMFHFSRILIGLAEPFSESAAAQISAIRLGKFRIFHTLPR
jgi:hypothetical protein